MGLLCMRERGISRMTRASGMNHFVPGGAIHRHKEHWRQSWFRRKIIDSVLDSRLHTFVSLLNGFAYATDKRCSVDDANRYHRSRGNT